MSRALKFAKANAFLLAVMFAYAILMVLSPAKGVQGLKNSVYYLKEMLMIMPVIFVLTALLDAFVPKATIVRFLGKESKTKGTLFAFVLGSISAGPIYAAFPVCVMLHKKGASIKNIIIILSSWAVVKIPMLLNEAKFLGVKFMAVRWVLTIAAILIFSTMADKIVRDSDLPDVFDEVPKGVCINREACMGCTICTRKYPELFTMDGKKAMARDGAEIDRAKLSSAIEACPAKAICHHE